MDAVIRVENSSFTGGYGISGGAIYTVSRESPKCTASKLKIRGSSFEGNLALSAGGGVTGSYYR